MIMIIFSKDIRIAYMYCIYNSTALFYIENNCEIKAAFTLFDNYYQLCMGSVKNVLRNTNVIYLQEELTLFFFHLQ